MEDSLLAIREYLGEGYRPLVDFNSWRVAILRWEPGLKPDKIGYMERHTETDEVFVLLEGWATLLIGGNQGQVQDILTQEMANGKLYNVRQNCWHAVLLSRDTSILLVENRDTGEANTEYWQLTQEQRQVITELASANQSKMQYGA